MQEPTFDITNQAYFRLARQPAKEHQAEFDSASRSTLQRDPLVQLSCRVGDAACAGAHADTLNRAAVQPAPDALLRLQRHYGNRFVQRVVTLARSGDGPAAVAPEVEQTIQQARGGGQALDHGVRAQLEPAFKADFSGVRVHTDGQADNLNRSLSARAFATGQDIFFKQGEYNPGSSTGRELLAHELTHVVQQNGAGVQTKLTVGAPGDRYEQEADSVARAVMQQEQQPVQRQGEEEEKDKETPMQAKFENGQVQRQGEEEEKDEEPVQAKFADGAVQRQPEIKTTPDTRIQRVLPLAAGAAAAGGAAITEPIEVVAALASIAALTGQVYAGGSGSLTYTSGAADRLSEQTQPKNRDYEAVCLDINATHPIRPNIIALFKIVWQGNDYGEIGAARVRVDTEKTSEFIMSSLSVRFEPLRNLIQPRGDKRTWQMEWDYEGTFDPVGAGEYWFQGSFAIDAFGNFRSIRHTVRDLSTGFGGGPATSIVRQGQRIAMPIPPIPNSQPPSPSTPPSNTK